MRNDVGRTITSFIICVYIGPFVMTSEEEILEARKDYQFARNGFENAHTWNSFIVTEDESEQTFS